MRKLIANLTEDARLFAETRKLLGSGGKVLEVVEDEQEQAPEVAAEPLPAHLADRDHVFSRPIFPTLTCLLSSGSNPVPTLERWLVAASQTGARLPALRFPSPFWRNRAGGL